MTIPPEKIEALLEAQAKSTPVVAWYAHTEDLTIRGPWNRWFKVSGPTFEHQCNGKVVRADAERDVEFLTLAANLAGDLARELLQWRSWQATEAIAKERDEARADAASADDLQLKTRNLWLKEREENARLRAALQVFANIKAADGDDFSQYVDVAIIRCEVTAKDLRLARAALGEK
jgi:hypothetical protein